MYTKEQMLDQEITYDQFVEQFVTNEMKEVIARRYAYMFEDYVATPALLETDLFRTNMDRWNVGAYAVNYHLDRALTEEAGKIVSMQFLRELAQASFRLAVLDEVN
jgi:hypothetical protein